MRSQGQCSVGTARFRLPVIVVVLVALSLIWAVAGAGTTESSERGVIDYEKRIVQAVGKGFAPRNVLNEKHAEEQAREAAKANAQKNLAELVDGVRIEGSTTVVNFMANTTVKAQVSAKIYGAQIVKGSEKWDPKNRVYELRLEMPMDAIGDVLLVVGPVLSEFAYTGLIVDCTGQNLTPTLSVTLFDQAGNRLLELVQPTYRATVVQDPSVPHVGTYTVERAKRETKIVGSNPLVVHAVGVKGNDRLFPIIAGKDANKLRSLCKSGTLRLQKKIIIITD